MIHRKYQSPERQSTPGLISYDICRRILVKALPNSVPYNDVMKIGSWSRLPVALGLFFWLTPSLTAGVKAADTPATLRFRLTGDPATLDWNLAQTSLETPIIMNLMEGLVEEGADFKPRPALAESWEMSADGLTYTFKLKAGVKWSDGKTLRAQDFVDSWLRLLNKKSGSGYASFLYDVENAEAFHAGKLKDATKVGVKAVGDSTFQVKLRRRVPYFLHIPTFWVTFPVRADLIRKHGSAWATPGKIATLGPYLLKEWKKGKSIVLERNPGFQPAPAVARVEAVIEPNESKAREQFAAGKFDFFLNATTEDLLQARSGQGAIRVEQYPYLATYYLGFDVRRPSVRDAEMRKALAAGIDRAAIPAALQGGQQVSSSFVPSGLDGYSPPSYDPMSLYDARAALARAGHAEGRGFPKLSLWVEKMEGSEALSALLIKSLQEKLGVLAEVRTGTPTEFASRLKSGGIDLFVRHWGADYPEPSNFLEVFSSASGNNFTGWKSAEYDQALERARAAADAKSRYDAYLQAEFLLIQKEAVVVPLFQRRNTVLIGPRVQTLTVSPLNYLFLKDVRLK
jgi:oligopeptide transport system substrate-binding protein